MAHKNNLTAAERSETRPDPDRIRETRTAACRYPTNPCGEPSGSRGRVAEPDSLVLELLKKIQAELSASRERDREVIHRLGNVEISVATLRRELGHCEESIAGINLRMDRMSDRIERIERRLDLTDG